jgi:hypothetical protein
MGRRMNPFFFWMCITYYVCMRTQQAMRDIALIARPKCKVLPFEKRSGK